MKFALYAGCTISTEQYGYELSVREVFPQLGVELVDIEGTSCCGYPLRGVGALGWLYLSARNLALVEGMGLDALVLCNGCHLSLCEAKYFLNEPGLKDRINSFLTREGLKYVGTAKMKHTLEVLHDDVGIDEIHRRVKKQLKGLKLAAHYGCHIIRPSKLGRPDDSLYPHKMEELIEVLGARSEDYPERLDCCGTGLLVSTEETAVKLAGLKLRAVQGYGFDAIVCSCPWCFKMFDVKQDIIKDVLGDPSISLPVFYYTQLLGLAMGIDEERLGLHFNLSPIDQILSKF